MPYQMNRPEISRFENFVPANSGSSFTYSSPSSYDHVLICVKCYSQNAVSERKIDYSHIPLYVYLMIVVNLFLGLLVIALSAGQHRLDLPLCDRCWRTYRIASILSGLSVFLFIASLVGGVAMMLQFDSGYAFFPLPVAASAIFAGLIFIKQRSTPKILKVDKLSVVVDAGPYGPITFSKATVAKLGSRM